MLLTIVGFATAVFFATALTPAQLPVPGPGLSRAYGWQEFEVEPVLPDGIAATHCAANTLEGQRLPTCHSGLQRTSTHSTQYVHSVLLSKTLFQFG